MDPTGGVHLSTSEREGQVGTTWQREGGDRGQDGHFPRLLQTNRMSWRTTSSKVTKMALLFLTFF
jgi:hypothetical protein